MHFSLFAWLRAAALASICLFGPKLALAQPSGALQSGTVAPVVAASPALELTPQKSGKALAQLRAFIAATSSARGEFRQETLGAGARPAQTASGNFAFARPGRFRWQVNRPFEQLMVADGQRLWSFDKDLNQVIERPLNGSLGSSPAALLFGSQPLESAFELNEAGRHDGLDWLLALPKSRDAGFERIAIGFRAGLPASMQVLDAFGRTTRFAFNAIERNPVLAASSFVFSAPPGADLIRQ
ncbi:MAG: outer membrane lipoprotein carrier protein LolA [Quisquiliibacterium sp.]